MSWRHAPPGALTETLIRSLGTLPDRLRQRRYELLPVAGPGAAASEAQGRKPGETTAPLELADLISSISEIGVLHPVLAEEIAVPDGPPRIVVTVGERRQRAVRWLAAHRPDNPHGQALPAIVCPGPMSEEERRVWQLIENLAREPLRPGEQASALLFHRSAVLVGKLLRAGRPVPAEVYAIDDPVERFRALERIRGGDPTCAAPWAEVLGRLGLQLTARKARELVRAFAELPRDLVEEMDEANVRLHTRIRFAELRRGRAEAADEIWAAVRERGRVDLLLSAVDAAADGNPPQQAVDVAEAVHADANQARAQRLRRTDDPPAVTAEQAPAADPASTAEPQPLGPGRPTDVPSELVTVDTEPQPEQISPEPQRQPVDRTHLAGALQSLRTVAAACRAGQLIDRHDANSLLLLAEEIHRLARAALLKAA
ncbi:ParB/RepB/Spo0J family partition protein [Micromonospora aurantiaca (nom. illeg.)]|uniref:ParB/RepB/Spo0J family partition protein n=1 Tax=Micromonospora aurantiaca (nom. illeg.) TaxID=47850 RepID=UPI0033DAEEEE